MNLIATFGICVTALFCVGAFLVWRGWTGERIFGSPYCGNCDYDLSATVPDKPHCPECGADLNVLGAVRKTKTVRRFPLFLGGAICTLIILFVSTIVISQLLGLNIDKVKPSWWLISELSSHDQTTRQSVFVELETRYENMMLDTSQINDVAKAILRNHRVSGMSWEGAVLLDNMIRDGVVNESILFPIAKQNHSITYTAEWDSDFQEWALRMTIEKNAPLESILVEGDIELKGAVFETGFDGKFKLSQQRTEYVFNIELLKDRNHDSEMSVMTTLRAIYIPTGQVIGRWDLQSTIRPHGKAQN